jgi:hypothetical protein
MRERILKGLRENLALLIVLVLIGSAFLFLRTKESDIVSITDLDAQLASGQPSLLEFFSNG